MQTRREQSRPVHLRAAKWAHPRRPAHARELAHLRARLGIAGSARLRRAHRSARPARARRGQLDQRLAALDLPRHRRPLQGAAHSESRRRPAPASGEAQENYLQFLAAAQPASTSSGIRGETDLEARIASYELAAKLADRRQGSARHLAARATPRKSSTASTIPRPPSSARAASSPGGSSSAASASCQLYTGNQTWDHHTGHPQRPARRLQIRGPAAPRLWSSTSSSAACSTRTVVHWGGEMGRLPVIQNDAGRRQGGPRPQYLRLLHVARRRRLQSAA